jgi:hypothetical protein
MAYFLNSRRNLLIAGALAISTFGMLPTLSQAADATATLSSASEVPTNSSAGTGTLEASVNKDSHLLTWTVTYSGLTGPATAGHFHGPAMAGSNAPVALPFSGSVASPIKGSATLTPAQMADLMAGRWYVNLHTAANPGGEIRGQVMVKP